MEEASSPEAASGNHSRDETGDIVSLAWRLIDSFLTNTSCSTNAASKTLLPRLQTRACPFTAAPDNNDDNDKNNGANFCQPDIERCFTSSVGASLRQIIIRNILKRLTNDVDAYIVPTGGQLPTPAPPPPPDDQPSQPPHSLPTPLDDQPSQPPFAPLVSSLARLRPSFCELNGFDIMTPLTEHLTNHSLSVHILEIFLSLLQR